MISVSWRLSCNVFSGILGDSVDLVQTGNGVTSLWTVKVVILARMQEVPDLRNHNSFRRLLMSINCELLSLPLLFILQARGHDAGEDDGPQGLIANYYHIECLPHSGSHAACTRHSRHNTWKYGPGQSPVSWAWRPCPRPCSRPMSPHRPVFHVSGIMMASVYCNELSNPGSEARNFDDGSGGSIG